MLLVRLEMDEGRLRLLRRSELPAPFVQYRKSEVSGEFLDSKNLGPVLGAV